MLEEINLYCDESCYLEHDGINVMGLGSLICPKDKVHEVNQRIKDIKFRNGISPTAEIKWTKVGPAKKQVYFDIINYFFDNNDLMFRALIVPDKQCLDHDRFAQTYDEWYYKMYFEMLKIVFDPNCKYDIYIDIKDTHSAEHIRKLHQVYCNDLYDFDHRIVRRVQPIRSDEVQIMQLVDILLGATTYANRVFDDGFKKSDTKLALVTLIQKRSNYSLKKTTLLREKKFNLLIWRAQ